MGWEKRKRRKASPELNRLLEGATDTQFLPGSGTASTGRTPDVSYVHYTWMAGHAACRRGPSIGLVGTMAASAQSGPAFDPAQRARVVEGYEVLQGLGSPRPLPGRQGLPCSSSL